MIPECGQTLVELLYELGLVEVTGCGMICFEKLDAEAAFSIVGQLESVIVSKNAKNNAHIVFCDGSLFPTPGDMWQ